MDKVQPRAAEAGLRMDVLVADDVPPWLMGDELRVQQVLLNLLGNAVKFTKQGNVTLDVRMVAGNDRLRLRFEVRDTGIGISPEDRLRLFLPFSQTDGSMTRRFGGTGLGLAISRQLVEMMGGEMGLESQLGQGSTFYFVLPFDLPTPADMDQREGAFVERPDDTGQDTADIPQTSAPKHFADKQVLVVEDNDINQTIIQEILESVGITVTLCGNGQEALEAITHKDFDLVLMDIQMPVMDGLEATQRIRALGSRRQPPIIALTAHAMPTDKEKSFSVGMNDHLTKPLDVAELFATMERWLPPDSLSQ